MGYVVTDSCIGCGACESVCPTTAIVNTGSQCEIKADDCISCGACAGLCPVEAIVEG